MATRGVRRLPVMKSGSLSYVLIGCVMMLAFVATRGLDSFWNGLGWGLALMALIAFAGAWASQRSQTPPVNQASQGETSPE